MNILLDGNLTFPPSEIMCVRDVTLYSTIWGQFSVLVEIEKIYTDQVWKRMKSRGAFDYVEDIVDVDEESGLRISDRKRSNIRVSKICCENLNSILNRLRRFG
jgi:hypothetical protein